MRSRGCSDLPPGCTHAMIEAQVADRPCDVCGRLPDDCICPECAVCGETGSARCYEHENVEVGDSEFFKIRRCSVPIRGDLVPPLVRSAAQIASLEAARAAWRAEAEAEEKAWEEMIKMRGMQDED